MSGKPYPSALYTYHKFLDGSFRCLCVRRAKARSFSGCESRPATVAPAGSNRGSRGGNEAAEASGVEGHEKWLGKYAGCNVSEH